MYHSSLDWIGKSKSKSSRMTMRAVQVLIQFIEVGNSKYQKQQPTNDDEGEREAIF